MGGFADMGGKQPSVPWGEAFDPSSGEWVALPEMTIKWSPDCVAAVAVAGGCIIIGAQCLRPNFDPPSSRPHT